MDLENAVFCLQTRNLSKPSGNKMDAKAASIIACALSKSVAELVLTCNSANEIWDMCMV
jgi:hypothetical protein